MAMKRIVLGIQYDGASWHGWQTQPNGHTVQDQLETALQKFTQTSIVTTCAGRTDAGVHALEQVVHFDTDLDRKQCSWVSGVNAFLPCSIAVRWACQVSMHEAEEFHARFSARGRTYRYILYNHPVRSPLWVGKAGWVFRPLNVERMQLAAGYLLGSHDFSAFRAAQCQAKTPIKEMFDIGIERSGDFIIFTFKASAFLHHMVRNLMGSLIQVGIGNQSPQWLKILLEARDRTQAAPTFAPDGLYLAKIDYDAQWGLPQQTSWFYPF